MNRKLLEIGDQVLVHDAVLAPFPAIVVQFRPKPPMIGVRQLNEDGEQAKRVYYVPASLILEVSHRQGQPLRGKRP